MSIALQVHHDNAVGHAPSGLPDPDEVLTLLPTPPAGFVRVPLWAAVQSDGPEALVTCQGTLRRSPYSETWATDPETCILWTVKLTPAVMVGGEFFVPVPLFPIPAGWEVLAQFSYATTAHPVRTRAVSVLIPEETYDWSQARGTPFAPRLSAG